MPARRDTGRARIAGVPWPWLLVFAAALVSSSLFVYRGLIAPFHQALVNPDSHYDFHARYFAATDLLLGANPYELDRDLPSKKIAEAYGAERLSEVYAPIVVALYIPLARLDFATAKLVWLGFNFGLACLSIWLLLRVAALRPKPTAIAAMTLVVSGFEPTVRGLAIGQANLPILILLCLGTLRLRRGKDFGAGVLFAAAAIYKPVPAIVFLGLILCRRWRAVAGGLIAFAIAAAVSVALFGVEMHASYLSIIFHIGRKWTFWFANQSLAGFFGRALINNELGTSWTNAPALARSLWLSADLALVGLASWLTLRRRPVDPVLNLSLWLVVGLLISPRTWDHHIVWAQIPFVVAAGTLLKDRRPRDLALVTLTFVLLAFPGMYWSKLPVLHHGPLLLITSSQTIGLLLLCGLVVHLHLRGESESPFTSDHHP